VSADIASDIRIWHTSQAIKGLILLCGLVLLYWPALWKLGHAWNIKPQSSHGYLVIPLSLWLCWRNRSRWDGIQKGGSYLGFFLLVPGLLLYTGALLAAADTLANISLMLSLGGLIICAFGAGVFRAYLFPYVFLIFMFPIPDAVYVSVTHPLKLLVSSVSSELLQAIGIPTYLEGNILRSANFSMKVVEACSGMRSVVAYLMLGTLLSYFLAGKIWKKGLLVFSAVPIAFFSNVLRITGTGVVSDWFGKRATEGLLHEFSGLIAFGVGFFVMYGFYCLLCLWKR